MTSKMDFLNAEGVVDTIENDKGIYGLFGQYRPFSNFHMESVTIAELTYRCSEAAYMAEKTSNTDHRRYLTTLNPIEAKAFGQTVVLIKDWDLVRFRAMHKVLTAKFSQSKWLGELLMSTGNKYIEETNWWKDTYWGVYNCIGQNNLGQVLMQVRRDLRRGST